MKKLVLVAAISAISTGAFATNTIDIGAVTSAATGAYAASTGGATSYQGGSVVAQNFSFGQVKSSDVDGTGYLPVNLATQLCDKDLLDAKYTTDAHTLEGTAFSGGKVVTDTFGSGTGESYADGDQSGKVTINATIKPENDGITLTVSPEAQVAGAAWSSSVNGHEDHDVSIAQAGETSVASVTVFSNPKIQLPSKLEGKGSNKHYSEGRWVDAIGAPQTASLATATSEGALCVGNRCDITNQVGAYVTGTGDGNQQFATTMSPSGDYFIYSVDAVATYANTIPVTSLGQQEYSIAQ